MPSTRRPLSDFGALQLLGYVGWFPSSRYGAPVGQQARPGETMLEYCADKRHRRFLRCTHQAETAA